MTITGHWHANERDRSWQCEPPARDAVAFHRGLPGYAPTALVELPELAVELGVGRVFTKDESTRLGLPAFKALGASWAIQRALQANPSDEHVTIVTATDGNHGRAVAKFSKAMGCSAKIVVPTGVHESAIQAIRDEGAEVSVLDGSYDDAVAQAARIAEAANHILVQDTAWEGYEEIPGWIVEGYATLFAEVSDQLNEAGSSEPDAVIVPTGVGSFLQAALMYYRGDATRLATSVISVEPDTAACVLASLPAGKPVSVPTATTIMAGLNCGTPSSLAWPYMINGLDGAIAVTDNADAQAARDLTDLGVASGPCGAAGLAGLRAILTGEGSDERRAQLGITDESVLVMIVTEGSAANPALVGG